jgi:RNA polymerase sigma factor (sigma-70 family)
MTLSINIYSSQNTFLPVVEGTLFIAKTDSLCGNTNYPYMYVIRPAKEEPITENETIEQTNLRLGKVIKKYLDANEFEKPFLKRTYEKARRTLTEKNKGLVISLAINSKRQYLDLDDMIQEGNMRLLDSTKNWDYTISPLATHARSYIISAFRGLDHNYKTRARYLPRYLFSLRKQTKRKQRELTDMLGYSPTDDELAKEVGYKNGAGLKVLKTYQLRAIMDLDKEIQNIGLSYPDYKEPHSAIKTPEKELLEKEELSRLRDLLKNSYLDKKEINLLEMKFGLDGNEPLNNVQIGRKLRCSRETIRLNINKAIEKLRKKMI